MRGNAFVAGLCRKAVGRGSKLAASWRTTALGGILVIFLVCVKNLNKIKPTNKTVQNSVLSYSIQAIDLENV